MCKTSRPLYAGVAAHAHPKDVESKRYDSMNALPLRKCIDMEPSNVTSTQNHAPMSVLNVVLLGGLLVMITLALVYLTPLKHIAVIEPTIDDIDATEFYEMYTENPEKYIFLDVRNEQVYNRLHAAGSELMPLHTFYTERLFLPKNTDQTIVFICSGGVASGVAYHYLEHHGFFNLLRIEGGIEAWEAAGLPTVSSS